MNDEIKEIFEKKLYFDLDEKDYNKIQDYITNLQQNYDKIYNLNCKLREQHNITDIVLLDENYNLQQKNERLKKARSYYYEKLLEYEKNRKQMPEEAVEMYNILEGNR